MAYLVILEVVLIPLIVRTDTGHRNSEIYQAIQIRVLQAREGERNRNRETVHKVNMVIERKKEKEICGIIA